MAEDLSFMLSNYILELEVIRTQATRKENIMNQIDLYKLLEKQKRSNKKVIFCIST